MDTTVSLVLSVSVREVEVQGRKKVTVYAEGHDMAALVGLRSIFQEIFQEHSPM